MRADPYPIATQRVVGFNQLRKHITDTSRDDVDWRLSYLRLKCHQLLRYVPPVPVPVKDPLLASLEGRLRGKLDAKGCERSNASTHERVR